jgi:hypothetical protein
MLHPLIYPHLKLIILVVALVILTAPLVILSEAKNLTRWIPRSSLVFSPLEWLNRGIRV